MNTQVESAECIHGMCTACRYEDCACECHDKLYRCPKCLDFGSSPGRCHMCGSRKERIHELRVVFSEPGEDNEGEHFIGTRELQRRSNP